jgi:hypothetical protein
MEMALFKHQGFISNNQAPVFDQLFAPGTLTNYPGIYKCAICGYEYADNNGQLPTTTDCRQHHSRWACAPGAPQWRLIVYSIFSNT